MMPRPRPCRFRRLSTLALVAVGMACAAVPLASAQQSQPPAATPPKEQTRPRSGVDYWQPDWMVKELWGPGRMPKGLMTRLLRHSTYITYGVSPEYEAARSTVAPGAEATSKGATLYAANCASCHGRDGLGDGDAENALSPSPALLAYMIRRPISVDEYLLWTIAEGGVQFQSQMPAYKDKLSRDDIWHLIAYMRAGFPEVTQDGKPLAPMKAK